MAKKAKKLSFEGTVNPDRLRQIANLKNRIYECEAKFNYLEGTAHICLGEHLADDRDGIDLVYDLVTDRIKQLKELGLSSLAKKLQDSFMHIQTAVDYAKDFSNLTNLLEIEYSHHTEEIWKDVEKCPEVQTDRVTSIGGSDIPF